MTSPAAPKPAAPAVSPASLNERALQAIRDLKAEVRRLETANRAPVAIVGMGCRFPGAPDLEGFWDLLMSGRDPMGPPPADRWNVDAFHSPDPSAPGKTLAREGGYLPDIDTFDAAFFGISPREAVYIDPRQRLVLETAWESLEDAGIPPLGLAKSRTGVFMGVLTNDYHHLITSDPTWITAATGTGTANAVVANRLSYVFDLRGPSVSLDTACAGSLVAIHLACQSLRTGESSLALAGGVAVNLVPSPDISFSRMGALAPYGRCRTFDAEAAGMVRSEGAGVVVLKLLDQALADGDRIHAVIRGSTVNQDGRSNGIASPNGRAQVALLEEAYRSTGISPGRVQYVEAHGTGTTVGDAIEIGALSEVLAQDRPAGRPVVFGSVKSNIGHTESAAGVAGVIKTALALSRRRIPPNLHLRTPNPALAAAPFPIEVRQAPGAFPVDDEALVAGVSGFSFGGTNAHVILEEAPAEAARGVASPVTAAGSANTPVARSAAPADATSAATAAGPVAASADPAASAVTGGRVHIVPLSAASPEALAETARRLADRLDADPALRLEDVAYTAALRRSHLEHRLTVAGRTREEIRARLLAAVGDGAAEDEAVAEAVTIGRAADADEVRVAFVFSGQGSEYPGMGRDLMETEPTFRATIETLEPHYLRHAGWSLIEALTDPADRPECRAIDMAQPLIFAVQVALVALWRSWGIEPAEVMGQSMGEVAAAHTSGALDTEAAVRVIVERSRLLKTRSGAGATAVVGLGEDETRALLAAASGRLDVAGMTSFHSTLVAGDAGALSELLATLEGKGVFARLLETIEVPAHSPVMDDLVPQLVEALRDIAPRPATIGFVSTVTAAEHPGERLDAAYWGANLRRPFRVAEAVSVLAAKGTSIVVEVSPHPQVIGALRQCFDELGATPAVVRSLTRAVDGPLAMASALGMAHVAGVPVDWSRHVAADARLVSLPLYPWQRAHHWVDALGTPVLYHGAGGEGDVHPLLGRHVRLAEGGHVFLGTLDRNTPAWMADHRVGEMPVLPGAAYLEMAAAAAREAFGWACVRVEGARFERMLMAPDGIRMAVQTTLTPTGTGSARIAVHARPSGAEREPWTFHAAAEVRRGTAAPDVTMQDAPEAGRVIEIGPFYDRLGGRGLVYGPAFRGVRRLGVSAASASAEVAVPPDAGSYVLHPAILDGAFQTVAAILPHEDGQAAYLPSSVGAIELFGDVPTGCLWSEAQLRRGAQEGDETLTADLRLTDGTGRVVARVDGLVLTRFDELTASSDGSGVGLYRLAWVAEPVEPDVDLVPARSWILAGRGEVASALARRLESAGHRTEFVDEPDALAARLAAVRDAGLVYVAAEAEGVTEAAVRAACGAVLAGVKAMVGRRAPFWLVTTGAQATAVARRPEAPSLTQAPLWGVGRIVALEHPELMGGLVDLDPAGASADIDLLATEILGRAGLPDGDAPQIAIRGGIRHRARLEPLEADAAASVAFRPDATYLVTGGLTGLGRVTAEWMARHGAQHFLVVGRTPLPPRTEWAALAPGSAGAERVAAVRALESAGKSVHTESLDVADEAALTALLARWNAEMRPPIRGVVHAAGGIDDKLITNMSPADFDRVMRPKVDGTLALHRATRGLDLDHFVIYASASSIIGQIGQANYAAANAFEDALAFARRAEGLPATVLNWGPWGEVGLYARRNLKDHAGIIGVDDILPAEGMLALARAMAGEVTQAIVVKADWSRAAPSSLTRHLAAGTVEPEAPEAGEGALELVLMPEDERRRVIGEAVVEMVAAVLKLEPAQIHRRRPITAFGMDSIMAVELRNRIRTRFGVALTMVELFTGTTDEIAGRVESALMADEHLAALVAEVENMPAEVVAAMLSGEEEVA